MDKTTTRTITRLMSYVSVLIIVLMPFHAFLTVWGSSLVGHYTLLRLWKEILLLLMVAGGIILLFLDRRSRKLLFHDKLFWLICSYGLLLIVAGGIALAVGTVSRKAFAYGLLLDGRFLAFFCVTWLATGHYDLLIRYWKRILLIPAAITVGFALLQYALLPADFLKHFGYGPHTIPPTETVDQKSAYRRVQSTLRGANPFGAYLLVMLAATGGLLLRARRRWWAILLFVASLFALFSTLSRSAWIGGVVACGALIGAGISTARGRRNLVVAVGTAAIVFGVVAVVLRHNDRFENLFFHTSDISTSAVSSNAGHASALKDGLLDVAHQPWGGGTGTAGPASVYNTRPARIAENYYVQIAQETGLEGLIVFAAINVVVAWRLWNRRSHDLALVLYAGFVGLIVVNMLLHGWADDTLAYVWWGMAGAAMNLPAKGGGNHEVAE